MEGKFYSQQQIQEKILCSNIGTTYIAVNLACIPLQRDEQTVCMPFHIMFNTITFFSRGRDSTYKVGGGGGRNVRHYINKDLKCTIWGGGDRLPWPPVYLLLYRE